jgi:capsular exopolysaccharide synthesis family protein
MDQTQSSAEARLHFLDYWRVIKARRIIVFMVFLLVVIVVATVTSFQPKIYVSSARIKVEQERPAVAVFEQLQPQGYDPYFLQTQYEIIQSQKILYPVIERWGLQKLWGGRAGDLPLDFAFRRLKGNMAVRRYRDTSLIEIAVYDRDPRLAADIANTTADIFERDRLEVKRQQTQKGIDKLREEMIQQQERLRQAQAKVEQLRKELNVPVLGTTMNPVKLNELSLQQMESQLTQARLEAVGRETRLNEVKKLTPQQRRVAITILSDDINVRTLLQNLTDAELRLEMLKEDYGPDHPTVRTAIAARDKLQEQLDTRVDGIVRGFEVDYQMAQARVNELQKQLEAAKTDSFTLEGEKFLPFRNAQREEDLEERLYAALKTRVQQTTVEVEVPRSPVEVMDRAVPALLPVKPNIWLNLVLGGAAGLIMGVALAFFIEFLDTSVKKMEDVERYLGLSVLGVIAQNVGFIGRGETAVAHVEAYRMLRTNIEFAKSDGAGHSLCVLSAGAGEGKSLTIANLACVYAQHGAKVLVVDSDLRRPSIHLWFGISNDVGLADYLLGSRTVDEVVLPTGIASVSAIPSGNAVNSKAALPMLTSARMMDLIRLLDTRFDIVLYDTPPILGVSDAAVTAREVGTSILVIQHRRYPRNMTKRASQIIENAGGKLLGVVVNNVHVGQDEIYYYYHEHLDSVGTVTKSKTERVGAPTKSKGDEIELTGKY